MERLDILLVEDEPYDAKLVESALARSDIEAVWTRVDSEPDFIAALAETHDVVFTGALDDELAADCIKRGAADYLLKDRLARLGDAILGAIANHRARRERRQAEARLLTEAKARIVLHSMVSRSLACGALEAEAAIAKVLSPLLEPAAVPGLVALSYESAGMAIFEGRTEEPAETRAELRRELDTLEGSLGSLVFAFAAGPGMGEGRAAPGSHSLSSSVK
jgi:CheY-like chemotaxis protein